MRPRPARSRWSARARAGRHRGGALREAGAVILGKTNLSEWANFRSTHSSSGWSGRGGQTRNPYVLDRNPSGSSSGSAAAVAANLCAVALGTETDGSIVSPANNCGVVGIKPTVGLTSRAGVIPISHSQDTVGPHGAHGRRRRGRARRAGRRRSARRGDVRERRQVPHDYTQFLDATVCEGARIGVARHGMTGYSSAADAVFDSDPGDARRGRDGGRPRRHSDDRRRSRDGSPRTSCWSTSSSGTSTRTWPRATACRSTPGRRHRLQRGAPAARAPLVRPGVVHARRVRSLHAAAVRGCPGALPASGGRDGIDAALERHNLDALIAPSGPRPG